MQATHILTFAAVIRHSILFLLISAARLSFTFAQMQPVASGIIHGQINSGGEALSFATISLYRTGDSSLVTGMISDEKGKFELKEIRDGNYYLVVSFVGFQPTTFANIEISSSSSIVKLPDLDLKADVTALKELEVTSETHAMEYQIDRKVVDVSKQITSASGTAVDVLQNIPSVQVDVSGNVTLRGSSGFQVFIDGRPSPLSGTEALNQIPASSIDKIELITNPSARYDAEGTSGIMNIITRKNSMDGISGIIGANAGSYGTYGGDILLNYRKKKINYFIGGDYNNRENPSVERTTRITESQDTIYLTKAEGESRRIRLNYQLRGGLEAQIGVYDFISVNASAGFGNNEENSELDYRQTSTPLTAVNTYTSINTGGRKGFFYSISSDYEHRFTKENHKLNAQISYNWRDWLERNDNQLILADGTLQSGQRSTENGPGAFLRARLDYTMPLEDKVRIETGSQLILTAFSDTNKVYNLNSVSNEYDFQPQFSNRVYYQNDIFAVYGIYRNEKHKLGYQIGLRSEYTGRDIGKIDTDTGTTFYRWDIFPSAHISYQLPKEQQVMLNYSRRIERPMGWRLEPFITWVDAYNVRMGNPDLLPEYINSFELGYSKKIRKILFSLETYYRMVENKTENFRSVYSENIIMTTFKNVGTDHSLGTEGLVTLDVAEWWNIDLLGNLFYFRGDYNIPTLNNENTTWNSRLNNTFYIGKEMQLQVNSAYNSPSITAQGRVEDFYTLNAAIKRTFYTRKLSLTLQVTDILQSARRQFTSSGSDFKTEDYQWMKSPYFVLNISYRMNNYKSNTKSRPEGEGGGDF